MDSDNIGGCAIMCFYIILIILAIGIMVFGIYKGIYSRIVGNKQVIDINFTFNKALINIGDETIEVNVKKWNDYEGEQIQIITDTGKVYLTSANNILLMSE